MYIAAGQTELNIALTPVPTGLATLYGRVTDADTGQALPNAKVRIAALGLLDYSDSFGDFRIENITPGTYTGTVELAGYETAIF